MLSNWTCLKILSLGKEFSCTLTKGGFICLCDVLYYSITCIQRSPKGSNKSGLLQQVVFKCRFYFLDLRRGILSEQWSLKTGDCIKTVGL